MFQKNTAFSDLILSLKSNRLIEEYFKRRYEVKAFSWMVRQQPVTASLLISQKILIDSLDEKDNRLTKFLPKIPKNLADEASSQYTNHFSVLKVSGG